MGLEHEAKARAIAFLLIKKANEARRVNGGLFAACGVTEPGMGMKALKATEDSWALTQKQLGFSPGPLQTICYEGVNDGGKVGDYVAILCIPEKWTFGGSLPFDTSEIPDGL